MTKIRISGISDLATARATAALDINYIGLNLTHGSEKAISPIKVSDYTQWLSGVQIIAQVHHLSQNKAERFIDLVNLPFAEILDVNATDVNDSIWNFTDSYDTNLMHSASTKNINVALSDFKSQVFLKTNASEYLNIDDLKAKGILNFDIEIDGFIEEGQLVFEKLDSFIKQIKA